MNFGPLLLYLTPNSEGGSMTGDYWDPTSEKEMGLLLQKGKMAKYLTAFICLFFLILSSSASVEAKAFIRESTYLASEEDSKKSGRTMEHFLAVLKGTKANKCMRRGK